jgi:hypothetical protein
MRHHRQACAWIKQFHPEHDSIVAEASRVGGYAAAAERAVARKWFSHTRLVQGVISFDVIDPAA